LSSIAMRYGVTVAGLVQENALISEHRIIVGQTLRLPGSSAAERAGADSSSTEGSGLSDAHLVLRGETLSRIARRYGTTVAALMQANELRSTVIHPGQVLRLAL
jgi:LysM repeat protein